MKGILARMLSPTMPKRVFDVQKDIDALVSKLKDIQGEQTSLAMAKQEAIDSLTIQANQHIFEATKASIAAEKLEAISI